MGARSDWTRARLEAIGFEGWVTFTELAVQLGRVSASGGVYIVVRAPGAPAFLPENPGGHFKGKNPSVPEQVLRANWVDGAEVVYIGNTNNLHRRLREFTCFGEGTPSGHWGGRLIWQLADSEYLLVAWIETPGRLPRNVKAEMITAFRGAWGKPPFANEPHRHGR